ncbi:glycosyltransferase family 2 protein [Candidatus Woesearchaeota archaeon]|nr:glycosyltransferase family 2 protein [Candidatus Woesearchaeota archaeon]
MRKESVTVLIPAYNEEKVIKNTVLELKHYLASLTAKSNLDSYEIIVCINGSNDKTEEICKALSKQHKEIRYFSIKNKGMGIALREGVKRAKKDIITFVAADGEVLNCFIEMAVKEMKNYDFLSGSRYLVKKQVRGSSFARRFLSIGYSYFIRMFFSPRFTEVGTIKVFRRKWGQKVIKQCKRDDPSWQVEMLYLASRDKLKLKEIPVYIKIKRASSESKASVLKEIYYFFKITAKYSLLLRWHQIKKLLGIKH